jgi:hypothetical protein
VVKAFETCLESSIVKKEFESTILYHSLQNDEIFVFYQIDLKKQFGNDCFDSVLKLLEINQIDKDHLCNFDLCLFHCSVIFHDNQKQLFTYKLIKFIIMK